MKSKINLTLFLIIIYFSTTACQLPKEFTIENDYISRTIGFTEGKIHTVSIKNKVSNKEIIFDAAPEFQLRISKGTHIEGSDILLTSNDFVFEKIVESSPLKLGIRLKNKAHELTVTVYYELNKGDAYAHKYLRINTKKDITLERLDIEVVKLDDIYQPYKIKQITARGHAQWKPGLGQPLYTKKAATFWGIEFPASFNFVENKTGYCGYLWGNSIKSGEEYISYKSVVGVGDNPEFIQDTFFEYIDNIRIRPLRLQIQYNSWFDFGNSVSKESFAESVAKINEELVIKRGTQPLKAYVIDDGWQDAKADWSEKTWKVNQKFDADFKSSLANVNQAKSNLGLWLSPGCLFGAETAAQNYKVQGFETLGRWMSMAGPKYMQLLENRMLELTKMGVTYFKLDGLFGHLNTREFELNGNKYGIPYMPQLGTKGLSPSDSLLNNSKYDELKMYYLVAGTDRLIKLFKKQHEINPEVYVVISNGAYLSPWWLMYIDTVWMINAGDAAGGSNRTQELVYRDGVYYTMLKEENTQFPINSIFNHEPKKVKTGESKETFSQYLWMNLSRGTGFIELYIKTQKLSDDDWDVLANGLKWVHKVFPYFKKSKMHGGDPKKNKVYGYTGWNKDGGYISFHNPSNEPKTYRIKLDRKIGLPIGSHTYATSSPLPNANDFENRTFKTNEVLEIQLNPKEIKVLEFNKQ